MNSILSILSKWNIDYVVSEALVGDEPPREIENKTNCTCSGKNVGPGARLFISLTLTH